MCKQRKKKIRHFPVVFIHTQESRALSHMYSGKQITYLAMSRSPPSSTSFLLLIMMGLEHSLSDLGSASPAVFPSSSLCTHRLLTGTVG